MIVVGAIYLSFKVITTKCVVAGNKRTEHNIGKLKSTIGTFAIVELQETVQALLSYASWAELTALSLRHDLPINEEFYLVWS